MIAVLGGGLMGAGIAEAAASAGMRVAVRDVDDPALEAARARVERSLDQRVRRGTIDASDGANAFERVAFTRDLDVLAGAEIVIEAVPEQLALKSVVLAEAAAMASPDALIASNTSSIPIAQLAAGLPAPERVLGLHFFSPVAAMSLVEIVIALDTAPEAVVQAREFVARIGKTPIETKDRSGFIVNALLVPYLMAAIRMYEERFASAEDIDNGMRLGCGHPMGPLALSDLIGLDVLFSVCESLYDEFKRPEYAPPPLLKRMVASGRLGRKTGRGFYEYDPA
jgi:3-hydroxybutyryl-CoA dehydrogenase